MHDFSSYPRGYSLGNAAKEQLSQGLMSKDTISVSSTHNTVSPSVLSQLQAGETFQGEIVSVSGEEVNLKLLNGQYLAARLEGQMQLAIGQILNFQVQANENSKIILKPLYNNLLQQQVGEAALKTANLAVNSKTLQMVSLMMEHGLPVDKNSLTTTYRLMLQNPSHNIDSILQLQRYQLPVNEENLNQYESYKNLEYKLLDGIGESVSEILEVYHSLANDTEGTFLSTGNTPGQQPITSETIMQSTLVETSADLLSTQKNVDVMSQQMGDTSEKLTYGANNAEDTNVASNGLVQASVGHLDSLKHANSFMEQILKVMTLDKTPDEIVNMQEGNHSLSLGLSEKIMTPQEIEVSLQSFSDSKLSEVVIGLIQQESIDLPSLMQLFQTNRFTQNSAFEEMKQTIFSSEPFQRLFRKQMTKEWTLSLQEVSNKDTVQNFYRKLYQQSAKLSELMDEMTNSTGLQSKSMQTIQQNVDFMNQINQVFQFMQLPVKFSDKHGNGELYVFTNKKNLAKKEGTLTALLHLDMEHLGYLDIHISLNIQQNQVTTKFSVDEDMIPFLLTHIEELNKRLELKGYRVKTSVGSLEEKKAVLKHIEEGLGASPTPIMYQAFDVRM